MRSFTRAPQPRVQARETDLTALRVNPEDARAYFRLGDTYSRRGQYEQALEAWKHIEMMEEVLRPIDRDQADDGACCLDNP